MLEPQRPEEQRSLNAGDLSIQQRLCQQIEYYFSFVNLVTDEYMLAAMQQTTDGSVSMQELLQFRRVRELLAQCFECELSWPEKKSLLERAVGGSSKLVVRNGQIKPKRRFKWQRDRKRVLYLEGQGLTRPLFLELLQSLDVPPAATFTRQGQNWLLAEFPRLTQPQLRRLTEGLTGTAPAEMGLKIIRIDAFSKYLQRFNAHFHPPRKYWNEYEMPRQQMLQYDEIPIARRYKLGEDEEIQDNSRDYEYIFRNLIDTRNPMTPERYEARRTEKIQEWRKRKQQRMEQGMEERRPSKMEAQQ